MDGSLLKPSAAETVLTPKFCHNTASDRRSLLGMLTQSYMNIFPHCDRMTRSSSMICLTPVPVGSFTAPSLRAWSRICVNHTRGTQNFPYWSLTLFMFCSSSFVSKPASTMWSKDGKRFFAGTLSVLISKTVEAWRYRAKVLLYRENPAVYCFMSHIISLWQWRYRPVHSGPFICAIKVKYDKVKHPVTTKMNWYNDGPETSDVLHSWRNISAKSWTITTKDGHLLV